MNKNHKRKMKKVKGYYVRASIDERTSGRVKGPFRDHSIAILNCDKAGWWDSPGTVEEAEFVEDTLGNLYEVPSSPLRFSDDVEKTMTDTINQIKEKLSPVEWEFMQEGKWKDY